RVLIGNRAVARGITLANWAAHETSLACQEAVGGQPRRRNLDLRQLRPVSRVQPAAAAFVRRGSGLLSLSRHRRAGARRFRDPARSSEARLMSELFELELLGGAMERRYRKARPEVEAMPWGTLDVRAFSEEALVVARRSWTSAAFQEHRTASAC